ncbi:MAG: cadmium-translocating P-type ATPase [Lachnospiraceae bacterium]|nr:cadmium-translocating P-type ATPase [Lachnospiraceae bacterium]
MTKKQKKELQIILVTAVLFAVLLFAEKTGRLEGLPKGAALLLFIVPYLLVGKEVLLHAFRNIREGNVFDENFLMMIATFGAFVIGEYPEAVAVMLFYQIGEWFQEYAVGKSRASITQMMEIIPESAFVKREGAVEEVDPEEVQIGETIVIKPGEKIPLDGVVLSGRSFLNTSALTGESVPRSVTEGEAVISGCVNGEGLLEVRVTKTYEDSTAAKILELVEDAGSRKARVENFITRFARYYTPAVTLAALFLGIVPPLILGGGKPVFFSWLKRACIFLVVSCPCALVISVPLGFFGGIGAASKKGILVKGSNFLEMMSEVRTLVFDKTGTLTKGVFHVSAIVPAKEDSEEEKMHLLETAAYAEAFSDHPLAQAIRDAYHGKIDPSRLSEQTEEAGFGIRVFLDGKKLLAGNRKLMEKEGIEVREAGTEEGSVVYISENGTLLGRIAIADEIKEEAKDALCSLKENGIRKNILLTGDRKNTAEAVAEAVGHIDEVHSDLLPADKMTYMEEILKTSGKENRVAFAGDGINDAPVLMRADVGIAMGSLGSDAAIEAADIVLMDDDLRKIPLIMQIGKKTMRIVKQNIVFALAVKALVLLLGALGLTGLWEAVFADVGVAVLAILNSMRTLRA